MDKKRVIEIVKTAVFIIAVPSVVVGAYYGFKFIKKKMDDRAARKKNIDDNAVIDATGMKSYLIKVPFKYQADLFTNGKLYDSISTVKYLYGTETVNYDSNKQPSEIQVEITASPVDIQKIKSITEGLNKEIKVEEKTINIEKKQ